MNDTESYALALSEVGLEVNACGDSPGLSTFFALRIMVVELLAA